MAAASPSPLAEVASPIPPLSEPSASTASLSARQALQTYKKRDDTKVRVYFKAIGNAPIMKKNLFRITAFNRFQAVIQFLRKELNWKSTDPLFLYINSSFAPSPDDTVGNLFKCFGTGENLNIMYSTTAAWG